MTRFLTFPSNPKYVCINSSWIYFGLLASHGFLNEKPMLNDWAKSSFSRVTWLPWMAKDSIQTNPPTSILRPLWPTINFPEKLRQQELLESYLPGCIYCRHSNFDVRCSFFQGSIEAWPTSYRFATCNRGCRLPIQSKIPEDVMICHVQNLLNMHCAMIGACFLENCRFNGIISDETPTFQQHP